LNRKITDIKIKGIDIIQERELLKLLSINKGELFSIYKIDKDIKNLLTLNKFKNIKADIIKTENGCSLIYRVIPYKFINEIRIKGLKKNVNRELYKNITTILKNNLLRKPYKINLVENIIKKIKNIIIDYGYLYPYIKYEHSINDNSIRLKFYILFPKKYFIEDIKINNIDKTTKYNILQSLKIGKRTLPSKKIINSLLNKLRNHLKNQGYFMNSVSYNIKQAGNGKLHLIINVKKGKQVSIKVFGIKINPNIFYSLWENVVFPPWAIEEGKNKIILELRKKGYILPEIKIKSVEKNNKLSIDYLVDKGKRYRLGKISFIGNSNISSDYLKEKINIYLKDFYYYAYLDGSILKDILYELEYIYWKKGFKNVNIVIELKRELNKINIVFKIKEGKQNIIKKVKITGAAFFNPYYLIKIADIKENLPYNDEIVLKWENTIKLLYYSKGFDDIRITPVIKRDNNDNIELTIKINENTRFRINEILWLGEKNISQDFFWSNVLLKKGEYLDRVKLLKTRKNLEGLGVFNNIQIKVINSGEENEKNIVLLTEPAKKSYLSYGFGWGERVGLRGMFEYQLHNLFGRANSYSFVLKLGKNEKRTIFSFDTPWKTSIGLKTFISLWMEEEALRSYTYNRIGITINAVKKYNEKNYLTFDFKIINTKILSLDVAESEIDRENAPYSTSSFSISYNLDRRDDPFNPSSGFLFYSSTTLAFNFLGTETQYFKILGKFQKLWRLKNDIVILNHSRWGFAWGNVPIVDRFFAGGSFSFRGISIDGLGPLDPITKAPIGGKAELLNNLEIILPTPFPIENLKIAFFYDKGNVLSEVKDIFKKSFDDAVGVGLRYKTPIGPFRIDLGWNLEKYGRRKPYVYFAIGNIF
jgi:outer membrane protein insertion porin family